MPPRNIADEYIEILKKLVYTFIDTSESAYSKSS